MALLSDSLYCDEEPLESNNDLNLDHNQFVERPNLDNIHLVLTELDLVWDEAELGLLLNKEAKDCADLNLDDVDFVELRKEAVEWVVRVCGRLGFSAATAVLAVAYFDRLVRSGVVAPQKEKAWMGQLTAVACLSLAAKMEEVEVPLIVDFQVEGAKFVFEARTVQRMELLVLSSLKWRMNVVTPFIFLDHFIRRFGLKKLEWEFLKECESIVITVISDTRTLCYPPSLVAAATMLFVIQEFEPSEAFRYQDKLIDVLKICEDKLDECYHLISGLVGGNGHGQKRKYDHSVPSSPHGVIDMSFSCENSNDSWVATSKTSLPSEPPSKRSRTQDQNMRLRLPFTWPSFS